MVHDCKLPDCGFQEPGRLPGHLTRRIRCLRSFCDSSRECPLEGYARPAEHVGKNKKERPRGRSSDDLPDIREQKKCSAVTLGLPLRFLRNSVTVPRGGQATQGLEATFLTSRDYRSLR